MKLRRILSISLLTILLPSLVSAAYAKEAIRVVEGIVSSVPDGDTIHVTDPGGTVLKVRLYGIDAPEIERRNRRTGNVSKQGQPFGKEAATALREKIEGKRVKVEIRDVDRYRRLVSVVWLNNRNIVRELVSEGWAWAYRQYLERPHASEYLDAEEQARKVRRGLWAQENPQPPWEFRKTQKRLRSPSRTRREASLPSFVATLQKSLTTAKSPTMAIPMASFPATPSAIPTTVPIPARVA